MSFGVSSASLFPMLTEDTVSVIKSMGADICEFFLEAECEYEEEYISMLRLKCEQHGVTPISVHAFCSAFEPFIFSSYERRRADCMATFHRVLSAARGVGAKYYTFHGDQLREPYDISDYAIKFTELAEIAKSYGIVLAWENVSWCQSSNPQFIKGVLERAETDNLKFTLDIKQAYRANRTPIDYINVMGDRIANVHINDVGTEHFCMLPGQGYVDFKELFRHLGDVGYRGDYILEVYRTNYKEYAELKESLCALRQAFSDYTT